METEEYEKRLKWYENRYGPYIEKRGIHNWRNLFRKPTLYEWTILFMMFGFIVIGYLYMVETKECKTCLEREQDLFNNLTMTFCSSPTQNINFTKLNITLKEDDMKGIG